MITSSFELIPVFAYGHSQLAETGQGRTISSSYADRVRTRLNMGEYSNRASASYQANDAAILAFGNTTKKWNPTTASVVFVDLGINDLVGQADCPKKRNGFKNSFDHLLNVLTHGSKISDANFPRSGSWTSTNSYAFSNGSRIISQVSGSYCVVPFSGDKITLTLWGTDDSASVPGGATALIENESGSCPMLPKYVNTGDQSNRNLVTGNNSSPMAIVLSGFGSGSHSVRITHVSTGSKWLMVDDAMYPSKYPPTIIVKKIYYMTSTAYGSYGSDELVDDFNDVIVDVCSSHSTVIVKDVQSGFNMDTMLHTDGGHYNDIGSNYIAGEIIEEIKDLPFRSGQNTIIS